jgi:hypothetical protein
LIGTKGDDHPDRTPMPLAALSRRDFLALANTGVAAAAPLAAAPAESPPFPQGFLWGAANAAHQVEGNNIDSDLRCWSTSSPRCLPSHRATLATNTIDTRTTSRCSTDSASILIGASSTGRASTEQGFFSKAELDHYRRVLATCHENNVQPMVTFSHGAFLVRRHGRLGERCLAGSVHPLSMRLTLARITLARSFLGIATNCATRWSPGLSGR